MVSTSAAIPGCAGHQQAADEHVVDLSSLASTSDSISGPASGGFMSMVSPSLGLILRNAGV